MAALFLTLYWCERGLMCTAESQNNYSLMERKRFENLLKTWPRDKPKAAIYILTDSKRVVLLQMALRSLDRYFNRKFDYPVIVFHDGGIAEFLLDNLRRLTSSNLFLQRVEISPPRDLANIPEMDSCSGLPISYRNMCRFNTLLVYEEEIFNGLDYYWRLDTDSVFTREISFDIFKRMKENNSVYGYIHITEDRETCVENLWPTTENYIAKMHLKQSFLDKWPNRKMFYNNFEVSRIDFWRSEKVQHYLRYIDESGGIYYNRWGDAPIKSLVLALFLEWDKLLNFDQDIGYNHKFRVISI
jgi:hypothetical protein